MDPLSLKSGKVQLLETSVNGLYNNKIWDCKYLNSTSIAAQLLLKNKIIAVPTDTIYGLAGLAQNNYAIEQIYNIKKRNINKPLAICLAKTQDIQNWAYTDQLPEGLIDALLPGPTTIILRRKTSLNPALNPEIENVGIRVPNSEFMQKIVRAINQPIALTSANESNEKSSLSIIEFSDLWPKLDGIFEDKSKINFDDSLRVGSSVIDLSVKGKFKVVRAGISFQDTKKTLKDFGLSQNKCET